MNQYQLLRHLAIFGFRCNKYRVENQVRVFRTTEYKILCLFLHMRVLRTATVPYLYTLLNNIIRL